MELRHLHVVLTVARAGSISRAASQMKIAQAGLTAQVRRIEATLGGPLFLRRTGGVELTELGRHVVLRAQDLVERFDDLVVTSNKLAERGDCGMRLGGVVGSPTALLVRVVREVLPSLPQTTHVVRDSDAVLELVRTGDLDLALVVEFPRTPLRFPKAVGLRGVATERMLIGVPVGHRLSGRSEVLLSELAGEEWVVPDENHGGKLNLDLACEAVGFTPRCTHFGVEPAVAAELVRSTGAVAGFFAGENPPGVLLKPIIGNPLRRRITLVWNDEAAQHVDDVHDGLVRAYHERTPHPGRLLAS
ncbi:DNA-binding transcriptional regulator, LysR family [Lentzea fradiae]|uniref:DNA-binding transcriptional regulator, LysR family n=1 Tax=Lentzea fradiae TaxID=200378 RepID=A0A1G7YPK8_9PSEU|nr:LysR family transcriptional regulator [Lentzea fradiae]SDG98246.1 DNA-binding transcriptional regulator, LysR family [Lentzea fradiae]